MALNKLVCVPNGENAASRPAQYPGQSPPASIVPDSTAENTSVEGTNAPPSWNSMCNSSPTSLLANSTNFLSISIKSSEEGHVLVMVHVCFCAIAGAASSADTVNADNNL